MSVIESPSYRRKFQTRCIVIRMNPHPSRASHYIVKHIAKGENANVTAEHSGGTLIPGFWYTSQAAWNYINDELLVVERVMET